MRSLVGHEKVEGQSIRTGSIGVEGSEFVGGDVGAVHRGQEHRRKNRGGMNFTIVLLRIQVSQTRIDSSLCMTLGGSLEVDGTRQTTVFDPLCIPSKISMSSLAISVDGLLIAPSF